MYSLAQYIGTSGAILLVIAWLASLIRTIRSKKHTIDPIFTAIYLIASFLLTIYSILIADTVFSILNAIATIIAGIEFVAYFYYKK